MSTNYGWKLLSWDLLISSRKQHHYTELFCRFILESRKGGGTKKRGSPLMNDMQWTHLTSIWAMLHFEPQPHPTEKKWQPISLHRCCYGGAWVSKFLQCTRQLLWLSTSIGFRSAVQLLVESWDHIEGWFSNERQIPLNFTKKPKLQAPNGISSGCRLYVIWKTYGWPGSIG